MLYIAIMPAVIPALAIAGCLMWLARAYRRVPNAARTPWDALLAVVVGALSGGAFLSLYFTHQSPIAREACLTGIFGFQTSVIAFLLALCFVGVQVVRLWKTDAAVFAAQRAFFLVALLSFAPVVAAFLRSALRCTV